MNTVWPRFCRRPARPHWRRERLTTPDDDFIDVDWLDADDPRLVLLFHGLEGSSESAYVRGMAHAFARRGWGVLAMNYRGCSGEPNRALRSYHSGATDDVGTLIARAAARCDAMLLVGFSLGGNLVLKYLGEAPNHVPPTVAGAVAFSAPVDLHSSAARLSARRNRLYERRFLNKLKQKLRDKARIHPQAIDLARLDEIRTLHEVDDFYTAPVHGFRDADDYYRRSSARPLLGAIRRPALIVNALDDPMLGSACYPAREAAGSPVLRLETPRDGGHVGFVRLGGEYWSERRALHFAREIGLETASI